MFPLLGHAAMNVRPSLLTVYETHFVPLGERLGPGLSGFLSGVLPGLEDGSDHFDRLALEREFCAIQYDCFSIKSLVITYVVTPEVCKVYLEGVVGCHEI